MFKIKLITLVFIFLILLSFIPSVISDSGSDSFDYSTGAQDAWNTGPNTDTNLAPPTKLWFNKIEYYDQIQRIEFFYNDTGYSLDADAPPSVFVPFNATIGVDTLGEGIIGYGIGEHGGQEGIWVYLIFYNWDRLSYTGDRTVTLDYVTGDLYTLSLSKWLDLSTAGLGGDKYIGITQYSGGDRTFIGHPFKITSSVEFHNNYDWYNATTSIYYLNVTRNFTSITYPSMWKIYTSEMEYVNETSYADTNFSVAFWNTPIYLECEDLYNTTYSDTLYGVPGGAYNVHGRTFDAKTHSLVQNTRLVVNNFTDISNETGFYQIDSLTPSSYILEINHTSYQDYDINFSILNLNVSLDVPLIGIGINSTTGDYDASVPYLGVVVKNQSDYEEIKSAYLTLKNNTTSYYAFTNDNGFGEIYPQFNGTYTLVVDKEGYYSHSSEVNVSGATAIYVSLSNIEEITEIEPTPTPTTVFEQLISMFEDQFGLKRDWINIFFALAIIAGMALIFASISKNKPEITIMGAFFGFIGSIALGLLSPMFLVIVIIVVVLVILRMGLK